MEEKPKNTEKTGKGGPEKAPEPAARLLGAVKSLKPPENLPRWKRWLAWFFIMGTLFLALGGGILAAFLHELPGLPSIDGATADSQATRIFDSKGVLVKQLSIENRTIIELDQIPQNLINATIALEDQHFWKHWGIDVQGLIRAMLVNLKHGKVIQGGSSITQQLAKNRFLTAERSISRKAREAMLAIQIERRYTKQDILKMYFNQIYFGNGAYGVEAAARTYFGKHAFELNLNECAVIAGIPRSPNANNPISNPERSRLRRDTALKSMLEVGMITQEDYDFTLKEPIITFSADPMVAAYFVEEVRQQLEKTYGPNAVYRGGLQVYTTLDLTLQDYAQLAVERGAKETDIKALPYLEHEFKLKEKPVVQVAFIAMDPKTGAVRALVGGRDFRKSQFNRATQALRQPGSAFKPFIYTAALGSGFQPTDQILDQPTVYTAPDGSSWKPENFDKKFLGLTTIRNGLAHSRNIITVKLLEKIGTYNAINYAQKMGIKSKMTRDLTLALGTSEVTLLELTTGFCTLANLGVRVDPWMIMSVRDADGKILEENQPHAEEAIPAPVAYVCTNLLKAVLDYGTASNVRSLGFTRPAAGKTGTTSDFSDAWFVGYTPDLVASCWFGYDQRRRIGQQLTGGAIAAPVWTDFMIKATASEPVKDFAVPQGVFFSKVCAESGKPYDGKCRWIEEATTVEPVVAEEKGPDPSAQETWMAREYGGGPAPTPVPVSPNAKVTATLAPTPSGF